LVLIFFGAVGYAIGVFIQAPEGDLTSPGRQDASSQRAPLPLLPADGSEFVNSDITLQWSWTSGLAADQRYALRIWTDDKPFQEVWTLDSSASVQQIIDSFSLSRGNFYWQVAVVNLDADGVYESAGSEWSEVSALQRLRRMRVPAMPYDELSATARQFHDRHLGASELIDAVHRFVNQNSLTNKQLEYAPDFSDAVQLMYDHSQGLTSDMPRLQCDGRSTAMLTILKELGIESRLVFLYKSDPGWLNQHTVLEVFNPDSQYWQTHDLSSDIYYAAAESGIRVNAESMLFGVHENIVGCPIAGGPCSADRSAPGLAYFGAMRYGFSHEVWVNPDRFDLSARFDGQDFQNLAEYIGAGHPQRVTFRLDSWLELE